MGIVVHKTYSEFKNSIPVEFKTKGTAEYKKFKECVGTQAQLVRNNILPAKRHSKTEEDRWVSWIKLVNINADATFLDDITDSKIDEMARGNGDGIYAIIVYYRIHALLEWPELAETIDELVFDKSPKSKGTPIFEDINDGDLLLTVQSSTQDLHFSNPITKVWGRVEEQKKLRRFLADDPTSNYLWLQLAGAGGQGKSRLAHDFVLECRDSNKWHAGFLDDYNLPKFAAMIEKWQPEKPTVIVIDYILGREKLTAKIFQELARRNAELKEKVRLLLVERQPWNQGALKEVETHSENSKSVSRILPSDKGYAKWFEELGSPTDRVTIDRKFDNGLIELKKLGLDELVSIVHAVNEFDRKKNNVESKITLDDGEIGCHLMRIDCSGRPLFAYLLARSLHAGSFHSEWGKEQLLDDVIEREQKKRWRNSEYFANQCAPDMGDDIQCMQLAILATMSGGLNCNLIKNYAGFEGMNQTDVKQAIVLNDGHVSETGKTPKLIPPLQPDIIGEWFVLISFDVWLDRHLPSLIQIAWAIAPDMVASFFQHCAQDFPEHATLFRLLEIKPNSSKAEDAYSKFSVDILELFLSRNFQSIPQILLNRAILESENNLRAMNAISYCYFEGIYVEIDSKRGEYLLEKAYQLDDQIAPMLLGVRRYFGDGVARNENQGILLLTEAATQGNSEASYLLCKLYLGENREHSILFRYLKKILLKEPSIIHDDIDFWIEEVGGIESAYGVDFAHDADVSFDLWDLIKECQELLYSLYRSINSEFAIAAQWSPDILDAQISTLNIEEVTRNLEEVSWIDAPIIPGKWITNSKQLLPKILEDVQKFSALAPNEYRQLLSVRTCELTFCQNSILVEVLYSIDGDKKVACLLTGTYELPMLLDGSLSPIEQLYEPGFVRLENLQSAKDYLQFYVCAISRKDHSFRIFNSLSSKHFYERPQKEHLFQINKVINNNIKIVEQNSDEYILNFCVLENDELYQTVAKISKYGEMNVIEEKLLFSKLKIYQKYFEFPFLISFSI